MKQQLEYFFAALRFFTRLPVPGWVGHSAEQLNHAARYFPLVGIVVGAIGAAVTELAVLALPIGIAVMLGMAATVLVTGGFHEDGFADTCDGFGGGWEKSQVLAIMKDSRVGSYAVIGLVLLLSTKWVALVEIDGAFGPPFLALALVAGHAASRLAATVLIFFMDYARDDSDDSAKSRPLAQAMSPGELGIAAACGLAPCLLLPWADVLFALGALTLTTLLAARYFRRRLGGYTGDCLGATQQLAELAFSLGMLLQLFLIRHPAPLVDAGICYGASDLALAGDVAAAAERIRPQLPPAIPVFSSPLQRCHQLATLLHPAPVSDDRLREMHFGEWEMTPWQQIQRTALDGWAADPLGYTPPGGESVGALQKRVGRFVAELALQDIARAGLVTHAGVMKVLLGMARDLPARQWMALSFDYESVVSVEIRRSHMESNRIP